MSLPVQLEVEAAETALPEEVLKRARLALSQHAECFWMRRADVPLARRGDVELIVRRLRENGGRAAWKSAREIEACL
jgi:hypothetical protein